MKYFIRVLAVSLLLTIPAVAGNLSFGFKAGLALSNQDFDYRNDLGIDFDDRLGFQGGVFAEIPLTQALSLQSAIQYMPAGFKAEFPETTEANPEGTGRIITVKPRIDYVALSVIAKLGFPERRISDYVIFGPRIAYQVGIRTKDFELAYTDVRKFTYGLTVGIGTEVKVDPRYALMVEVSYNPDFRNIFGASELVADEPYGLESIKNRTLSVQLGMRFGNVLPD
jgi:outer membrane immunogenic protein